MNVASLAIGIEDNHGGDFTEIKYIGLKGENTGNRARAVITVYESRANLKDHKTGEED